MLKFSPRLVWLILLGAPPLARADAGGERMVFCHYVPWMNVQNQEHAARRDFPLFMGFGDKDDDYARQIAWARKAGIDGFLVDCLNAKPGRRWTLRALRQMQKAAEKSGPGFWVVPCLDRIGEFGAEGLADFIVDALETKASPAWFRLDGKPVLWTYAAHSLPLADWPEALERVKAAGHEIVLVCDIGAWLRQVKSRAGPDVQKWLPEKDLVRWANLGALYHFDGELEPVMARVRQMAKQHGCRWATPTIGTLRPGYFSVTNGQWTPDFFTRRLRQQFPAVRRLDWINVTTWNDYAEDTHFEPSRDRLFCRTDLLRALTASFKGRSWPATRGETRWYLSTPWERYWKEQLGAEVLGLVPDSAPTFRVSASLLIGGEIVDQRRAVLTSGGVRAAQFAFTLPSLPAQKFARIAVEVAASGCKPLRWQSAPVLLWPERYHPSPTRCTLVASPTRTLANGPVLSFDENDGVVTRITAKWPGAPAGARVHINQNGRLRRVCDPAPASWEYDPAKVYNRGRPPWEVFLPVAERQRWGFFQAVGISPEGRVAWGTPTWVEPKGDILLCGLWSFEEASGATVVDSSVYGHDGRLVGDAAKMRCEQGHRGRCIRLEGKPQSVNLPGNISPPGPFTLSLWIRPEGDGEGMLYADVAAPIIFRLDNQRRLQLTRRAGDRWVTASGKTQIPLNGWTHVAATYDLTTLRVYVNGHEDGSALCEGERTSQRCALGRNPYGSGSAYFTGCIDEVRLEARSRPVS